MSEEPNILARLVPGLAASASPPSAIAGQPGEEHRHVMFASVEAMLRSAASGRPLVLVLDDLQWADKPTLLLLRYLLLSSQPIRALLVGTYRSSERERNDALDALLTDFRREPGVEWVTLAGLAALEVAAMVEDVAQERLEPDGAQLVQTLLEQTDGNPFFIGEIVRSLNESGGINRAGRAVAAGGRSAVRIPLGVRETIAARVRALGARATKVLSVAAVIGAEFDAELLAHACGEDVEQLADALDDAAAAALITEVPGIGMRFAFVHQLIALALYEQLGAARRRVIHAAALDGLERLLGEDERRSRIGELDRHALCGAPVVSAGKSVEYARLAGERALEQLAPQEALRWFDQALSAHEQIRPGSTRDDADRIHCDLLIGCGMAQLQVGDAGFRATLLRAADLARSLGDGERFVRAVLANTRPADAGKIDRERVAMLEAALATLSDADSASRARLLALLAGELTFSGEWRRRRALSDESVEIATRLGDHDTITKVLGTRFITIWTPETLAERIADSDRGVAIAEELGDPLAVFQQTHWKATAAVEAGDIDLAAELVDRESELAERLRRPTWSWVAAYDQATQSLIHGLLDEAERAAEDAWRIATESEPEALAFYAGQLINIRFEQGRLAELQPLIAQQVEANPGIPAFRAALALARSEAGMREQALEVLAVDAATDFSEMPYDSNWVIGMAIYAQTAATLNSIDAATRLYRPLEPWRDHVAFNSATVWGLVERHLGNLHRVLGRYDDAERALVHAAERHEQMGAPVWLARTRLDLARVLLECGRETARAAELLGQAQAAARKLGCASIERQANLLLEEQRQLA